MKTNGSILRDPPEEDRTEYGLGTLVDQNPDIISDEFDFPNEENTTRLEALEDSLKGVDLDDENFPDAKPYEYFAVVRHWFPPGFTRFCIASSTIHIRSYCITRQSCQSVNGDWMSTQKCELVHLTLFKHGAKSFLAALDDAGIPHGPVRMYSSSPKNSGLVEAITALSDAMPWNAIAKVIIAWIDARKSREVIIYTEGGESFHAKGYSASDVQKLLQISTNVAIIDTKPADEQ